MPVPHTHQGKQVLVVETDADMRHLLRDVVEELGLQVAEAMNRQSAIQELLGIGPHVILTDTQITPDSREYIQTIRALSPSCRIIALAMLGDHQTTTEALACGAHAVLSKPVSVANLQRTLIRVLDGE